MLKDELHRRMMAALKARDDVAKSIYRVAMGEVQGQATSKGRDLADDEVEAILRKLIKSNQECLDTGRGEDRRSVLEQESQLLEALLPKTLSVEEIRSALTKVADAIRQAKSDGQATGIAMKHLKAAGAAVTGQEVALAVKGLRS